MARSSLSARTDRTFDALGNPVRREILRMLRSQGMTVGEIAERLPVSRPAVSKHLRLLEAADLMKREVRGNQHYCSLQTAGFDAARSWLGAFYGEALGRFKLVAENTAPRRKGGAP